MRIGLYPGTFYPITLGHADIIKRAMILVDRLVIGVAINRDKGPFFGLEERVAMVDAECRCDRRRHRGRDRRAPVREPADRLRPRRYEFQMALANKKLLPDADTVFLTTNAENMYLSSSLVRQIASLGGDISPFVPEEIRDEIEARLQKTEDPEKN